MALRDVTIRLCGAGGAPGQDGGRDMGRVVWEFQCEQQTKAAAVETRFVPLSALPAPVFRKGSGGRAIATMRRA